MDADGWSAGIHSNPFHVNDRLEFSMLGRGGSSPHFGTMSVVFECANAFRLVDIHAFRNGTFFDAGGMEGSIGVSAVGRPVGMAVAQIMGQAQFDVRALGAFRFFVFGADPATGSVTLQNSSVERTWSLQATRDIREMIHGGHYLLHVDVVGVGQAFRAGGWSAEVSDLLPARTLRGEPINQAGVQTYNVGIMSQRIATASSAVSADAQPTWPPS
jgi:hypothetical protein